VIRGLVTRVRTVAISSVAIVSIMTFDRAALGRTSGDDDLASAPALVTHDDLIEYRPGFAPRVRQDADVTLRREPICHISRHPRDGIRASLHACPSLLALGRAVGAGDIARGSTMTASSEDYSGG
jgi:hypothetical protein